MSNEKLKIGVIGCGIVANIGHLPVYHKSPFTEIVVIADPLESHLKRAQERYNIPKKYVNPEDLIEDPMIDTISICSPHWVHAEQVIRATENGKHILCEKSIGINLEESHIIHYILKKYSITFK